jgi:hypothetical protein
LSSSHRGIDLLLNRHVELHGLDIFDRIECVDILLLSSAGVNEKALPSKYFRDFPADPAAGAGNQYPLLRAFFAFDRSAANPFRMSNRTPRNQAAICGRFMTLILNEDIRMLRACLI